ncbi:MAG: UDP-2,4-diacetamido-2,4,6-trideoxy-beta-L-altropyranose hydrolase [Pseudomonadota bacterium]
MKASGPHDRIAFRADGGGKIGAGHIMRCVTLANALSDQGVDCHFLASPGLGALRDAICSAGHTLHDVCVAAHTTPDPGTPLFHASWLRHSQKADAAACASILQAVSPGWLVLDHYALDARWQRTVAPLIERQMSIDDLADRKLISDLHVDPNPLNRHTLESAGILPAGSQLLLGCDYALLRPEFTERRMLRDVRQTNLKLLIMMGGVDQKGITARILQVLAHSPSILELIGEVHVILGAASQNQPDVEQCAAEMPCEVRVLRNPGNIGALMAEADLCIGAAGGSAWERCAMGLPSLAVVLAENQTAIAKFLSKKGASFMVEIVEDARFLDTFRALCRAESRQAMRDNAMKLVDGKGTDRVVNAMGAFS